MKIRCERSDDAKNTGGSTGDDMRESEVVKVTCFSFHSLFNWIWLDSWEVSLYIEFLTVQVFRVGLYGIFNNFILNTSRIPIRKHLNIENNGPFFPG